MIAAAALMPAEAVGREAAVAGIGPVRRLDEEHADRDEEDDDADLEQHHRVVRVRRFLDADHEDDRDQRDDRERRQVEDDREPNKCGASARPTRDNCVGRVGRLPAADATNASCADR